MAFYPRVLRMGSEPERDRSEHGHEQQQDGRRIYGAADILDRFRILRLDGDAFAAHAEQAGQLLLRRHQEARQRERVRPPTEVEVNEHAHAQVVDVYGGRHGVCSRGSLIRRGRAFPAGDAIP